MIGCETGTVTRSKAAPSRVHQHLETLADMRQQLFELDWTFQPPSEAITESDRPSDAERRELRVARFTVA